MKRRFPLEPKALSAHPLIRTLTTPLKDTHAQAAQAAPAGRKRPSRAITTKAQRKKTDHRPSSLALFLCLTGLGLGCAPALEAASSAQTSPSGAPGSADGAYVLESTAEPLVFEVALNGTTRIALVDERITALIGDSRAMSVQSDPKSGEVYVIPTVEGDLSVFLTTQSGTTVPLVLRSTASAPPGNLVLKRRAPGAGASGAAGARPATGVEKDTRSSAALAPLTAPDVENAAKKVLTAIAKEEPSGTLMKRLACPEISPAVAAAQVKLAALNPRIHACWSTQTMRGTVIALKNPRAVRVTIDLAALSSDTVVAVAGEKTTLGFGETGRITILEVEP